MGEPILGYYLDSQTSAAVAINNLIAEGLIGPDNPFSISDLFFRPDEHFESEVYSKLYTGISRAGCTDKVRVPNENGKLVNKIAVVKDPRTAQMDEEEPIPGMCLKCPLLAMCGIASRIATERIRGDLAIESPNLVSKLAALASFNIDPTTGTKSSNGRTKSPDTLLRAILSNNTGNTGLNILDSKLRNDLGI